MATQTQPTEMLDVEDSQFQEVEMEPAEDLRERFGQYALSVQMEREAMQVLSRLAQESQKPEEAEEALEDSQMPEDIDSHFNREGPEEEIITEDSDVDVEVLPEEVAELEVLQQEVSNEQCKSPEKSPEAIVEKDNMEAGKAKTGDLQRIPNNEESKAKGEVGQDEQEQQKQDTNIEAEVHQKQEEELNTDNEKDEESNKGTFKDYITLIQSVNQPLIKNQSFLVHPTCFINLLP